MKNKNNELVEKVKAAKNKNKIAEHKFIKKNKKDNGKFRTVNFNG